MSQFECPVVRVKIEPHHNADSLEIAVVGDYKSVVKKGQFLDGCLAIYIPEQAVLPEWLLKVMGFWDELNSKGTLSGGAGNRVRAMKLRGVVSQGLVLGFAYDPDDKLMLPAQGEHPELGVCYDYNTFDPKEGDDFAEYLGIVKYEPALPSHMKARVAGAWWELTFNYDFDNIKKKPDLFEDGEEVVITEKIHGTFIQIGVVPTKDASERFYKGRVFVSSKGLGAKGFVLDHNDPTNLYAQAAFKHGLFDKALKLFGVVADAEGAPFFMLGEVYGTTNSGAGVQDLTYGGEHLAFRAFDIAAGNRGKEDYCPFSIFRTICEEERIPVVPTLYIGPYSKEKMLRLTDGKDTISGSHIREGVVVKSWAETPHPKWGRKIAKSVSDAYLLRKSANATEFQ